MGLLGKPTILGNPHLVFLEKKRQRGSGGVKAPMELERAESASDDGSFADRTLTDLAGQPTYLPQKYRV